jgi:hypothetical protein
VGLAVVELIRHLLDAGGRDAWCMVRMQLAGRLGMVLARLTNDVTLRTVSAYDYLERGQGGGHFLDLGG